MLESTRAIGTEAWKDMTEAKNALQKAERLKAEIEPLHQEALSKLHKARKLREDEEKLIVERAEKLAETRVLQGIRRIATDRTQRLEAFCRKLQFKDGTTALDKFEELERERERQAIQRSKIPRHNKGFER